MKVWLIHKEKKQATETFCERAHMLDLTDKDFKRAIKIYSKS